MKSKRKLKKKLKREGKKVMPAAEADEANPIESILSKRLITLIVFDIIKSPDNYNFKD